MATTLGTDPLAYVHSEALTYRNLQYRPYLQCRLNVYRNATTPTDGNPVLVYTHGGGWGSNDKTTTMEFAHQFRQKLLWAYLLNSSVYGTTAPPFSVVSVEYRMHAMTNIAPNTLKVPDVANTYTPYERTVEGTHPGTGGRTYPSYYPDWLDDTQCAVQWVKENAERFGFDRSNVVRFGTSAGGNNSLVATLSPSRPFYPPGVPCDRFSYHYDSRVRGCLTYYPQINWDPWYYDYTLTAPALGVVANDSRLRAQMERLLLVPSATGTFPQGSAPTELCKALSAIHHVRRVLPMNAGMRFCTWFDVSDDRPAVGGYSGKPPYTFHDYQQYADWAAELEAAGLPADGGGVLSGGAGNQERWEQMLVPTYSWLQATVG